MLLRFVQSQQRPWNCWQAVRPAISLSNSDIFYADSIEAHRMRQKEVMVNGNYDLTVYNRFYFLYQFGKKGLVYSIIKFQSEVIVVIFHICSHNHHINLYFPLF